MSDLLQRYGARLVAGARRFFPPNGQHGLFLVEDADGGLEPWLASPNGEKSPVFFAAQRAQGIHWPTDPTYGAVGDGVTDDSDALEAARDAAGSTGTVRLAPGKTFRTTRRIDITDDSQVWEMHGATISVDHTGVGLRVGTDAATRQRRPRLYGGKVDRKNGPDWTSGSVGVEFLNTSWAHYEGFEVVGFERGVYFHANNGQGTSYVNVRPVVIRRCKFPLSFYAEDGGFVNENVVSGGSVSYDSSDPDATGGYAVHMDYSTSGTPGAPPNNNKVYWTSLESAKAAGKPSGAIYCNGWSNEFYSPRYEGFDSPFIVAGPYWGTGGGNKFFGGRGLDYPELNVDLTLATSQPNNYVFVGSRGSHFGGGSGSSPVLTVADVNSVSNVALRVKRTDGSSVYEVGSDGGLKVGVTSGEISRWLTASTTWNPASLTTGSHASVSVTVSGASVGDLVVVGFDQLTAVSNAGWHITGQVTSSSTVRVVLTNYTGSTVDLGEGTLKVLVIKIA